MPATREKALTERDFERLLQATYRIDNDQQALEARTLILVGGRLGLRPGELTHLSSSWIDWQRQMIRIPAHDPCEKGRHSGLCGYCRQAVDKQTHTTNQSFSELSDQYWQPKTSAAARAVPFHISSRVQVALEFLDDEHGGWPYSFSTLQRRLTTALQHAPGLPSPPRRCHLTTRPASNRRLPSRRPRPRHGRPPRDVRLERPRNRPPIPQR